MKSILKIFTRYVASAAAIAFILLVINLTVLFLWLAQSKNDAPLRYTFYEISDALTYSNGRFELSEQGKTMIHAQAAWAMLLDDQGTVIWSETLPDEIPLHYTSSDVASFTRWYLLDYPVHVWQHPQGLLVLGSAKGSSWKHAIEMPEEMMNQAPAWIGYALILNGIAAILLALLFGFRLFLSLRKLSKGIENIAANQPCALSTRGLLGDLADKLNQTSAQLKRQETALQKRDTARTSWIAGVSHDIRTPLSMVMGYASQLENNPHLPEAERQQAGVIRHQSEKIKNLVNDLNLASKLEYDMQPLRTILIDPAELARSVVTDRLNQGLGEAYSIELAVANEAQRFLVQGDEALLRRAMTNLIENSICHNADGCAIWVKVESEPTHCRITIADNGVGFPAEVIETLANPAAPTVIETHGLGLTIVQQILKSHGGTVEFKNLAGGACQAILRLPLLD